MKLQAATPVPVLTLSKVRARGIDVPLRKPAVTAAGTFRTWPIVLIDVETVEGVTGSVYIFAYEKFAVKPLVGILESFGELIAYIETAQGQAWSNVWSRPRLSKHDIEFYYAMTK